MPNHRNRAIAAAVAVLGLTAAAPASAQTVVQPGASIAADGSGYCTANWIYRDSAGTQYVGTAAHCVESVGQTVRLAQTSLGARGPAIGPVAFLGNADQPGRDYAFIRIDNVALTVDPDLKGHPGIPTGVSGGAKGDLMQFSGHGVGFHATQPTREERVGVLNHTDGVEHQILGGVAPGDSGGPVANLTQGGTAFGIVNTVGVGVNSRALTVATVGEGGADLPFVLSDAAARGFAVDLVPSDG